MDYGRGYHNVLPIAQRRGCKPKKPFSGRRFWACAALLMWLVGGIASGGGTPVRASIDVEAPHDYQVQAAMLYKFLDYIDWPATAFAGAQSPYRIAVLGDSDIENELRQITADRTVKDRPIEVYRVSRLDRISDPHLVFVGRRAERHLPRLAKLAREKSFLIVTENEAEMKDGSAINLRLIDGRIGFDVSLPGAQKSNVKLSSRLLSVASSVERTER